MHNLSTTQLPASTCSRSSAASPVGRRLESRDVGRADPDLSNAGADDGGPTEERSQFGRRQRSFGVHRREIVPGGENHRWKETARDTDDDDVEWSRGHYDECTAGDQGPQNQHSPDPDPAIDRARRDDSENLL